MSRPETTAQAIARWRKDRMAFRREAILLEDGRPFGDVMETWQRDDYAEIDVHRHAFLLRPRGHDKTGTAGTEVVTDLVLGPREQRIFGCAVDTEQAELLHEDVSQKFLRNPLLRGSVKIKNREITVPSTGSRFRVLTSDAPSAYGLRPDRIIVDELAEWAKRDLWDSLWSATGKRPNCRVLVITTAGWDRTSIAWEVQQIAQAEKDWYFAARGYCAGWISEAWREQQRRTLPAHVFARLHEARWVDGVGAFLTAEEVDAVFRGVPDQRGGKVAIGLDIGLSRDRTVAAAVRNVGGVCVVDHLLTWAGRPGRKVDLEDVEREVKALASRCGNAAVHYDPYQGVQMAQRLQRNGVVMREFPFTSESRRRLFATLLDLVRGRRLRTRSHDDLRRELLSLEVTQTASGWRVDHKAGRFDDHVVAVALGAQAVAGQRVDLAAALADAREINDAGMDSSAAQLNSHVRRLEANVTEEFEPAPWDF